MAEGTATPPGLEALANHLGYTFVKKDETSSAASASGDKTPPVTSEEQSKPKDDKSEEKKSKDEKLEKPKVPIGSQTSFANIYRNEIDDTWTSKEPEDTKPAEGEDTIGHAIVIRQQKSKDSRKKYEIHSIVVQSPALKIALGKILDGYPGVFCNLDRLVFKAPFEPFVHRWGQLLEYMEKKDLDNVTKEHLDLLHSIMKKELADPLKAFEDYVSNGVVTYEHAWIVFQPDAVVLTSSGPGEMIAVKMESANYADTQDGNFFFLNCQRVDWNGKAFGWAKERCSVAEFQGVKPIHELSVYPLAFHPRKESIKVSLIERGKRFAELAGYHYRDYDGPAIKRTNDGNILVQSTGRIVIDTDSFCKQPDQCKVYTVPLSSSSRARRGPVDDFDNEFNDEYDWDPERDQEFVVKEKQDPTKVQLTDYQYMLCTTLLRGYSIKSKQWLSFYVNHVKPIKWDSTAFDSLVIPATQKKLVLALSKTQAATANKFDDVISGKGKGMILLLSGPPGVGKTLTAEAVSENMQRPLYMMSAGDLGIRPDEVEWNLENILEMVAKWKAILLIDECDVFLEARSAHDLERNRLVSIFLRLLEYYQGTLFLTTNRVENMDPAFQSRIHVHMKYPDLTTKSRRQIWSSFLARMPSNFTDNELDFLARKNLNGRQIKNLVKTAQLLALEEQRVLAKEHIDMVLAIEHGFAEDELTV